MNLKNKAAAHGASWLIVTALLLSVLIRPAAAAGHDGVRLIPGGMPFGVRMYSEGILVVGVGEVACDGKRISPAKEAGITARDVICEIDGKKVGCVEDVVGLIGTGGGKALSMTVKRGSEKLTLQLTPVISDEDGKYRAGMYIRDSTAGIGTVTYIDPETGSFAGLGHGICDPDTGELVPLSRGNIVNVTINGIQKGKAGEPGELRGYFSSGKIGALYKNSECGVYGVFNELPDGVPTQALELLSKEELVCGEAELWCTVDEGGIARYKVNISEIDPSGNTKNFVVTVTDPVLLSKTGGIVQGMSGSPIIQDGKLVGAVTHVLINDPCRGYGIFIENMLEAAGNSIN